MNHVHAEKRSFRNGIFKGEGSFHWELNGSRTTPTQITLSVERHNIFTFLNVNVQTIHVTAFLWWSHD